MSGFGLGPLEFAAVTESNSEKTQSSAADIAAVDELIAKRAARSADPRWPLLRASKLGGSAILVLTVLSLLCWGGMHGLAGVWGVLIGAAVGGGFVLLTVVSVLITSNTTPQTTMAVVLGSWALKILVAIIVLAAIKGMTFYDKPALVITVILALVVGLASETWAVVTSRVTYIADMELKEERESRG